jgi:hypothetical protein
MGLNNRISLECSTARSWLFRLLDDELCVRERNRLKAHLSHCSSCEREWKLLTLPRRIGRSIPALEPSPSFYARLKARLEKERQNITIWQVMLSMSCQIVSAMATVAFLIISLFAYYEFRGPRVDLFQAYDSIFLSGDLPSRMVIAEEITDESLLHALAEKPLSVSPATAGR